MTKMIRYNRTTLEICDAFTSVVREGMNLNFYRSNPDLTCYNGRQWVDGMNNSSIYYVKSTFLATGSGLGIHWRDLRMAILRNSNESCNEGMAMFWCVVWHRIGDTGGRLSNPPMYESKVYRASYHVPRWVGKDEVRTIESAFDPEDLLPGLGELMNLDYPPHPIRFSL